MYTYVEWCWVSGIDVYYFDNLLITCHFWASVTLFHTTFEAEIVFCQGTWMCCKRSQGRPKTDHMFGVGLRGAGPRSANWGRGSAASAYPVAGLTATAQDPSAARRAPQAPSPSAADKHTTNRQHPRLVPYFDLIFSFSLPICTLGGNTAFASLDFPLLRIALSILLAFVSPA